MRLWRSVFGGGGGGCPSYSPGLYSSSEIDDLVFVDGYVPIANAAELDALRTTISQTMGLGTCWEGTYTTGLDKKYIVIDPIDMTGEPDFLAYAQDSTTGFSGIFDGNEQPISNIVFGNQSATGIIIAGMFFSTGDTELRNIRVANWDINWGTSRNQASILPRATGSGTFTVENCVVSGLNTTKSTTGGTFAFGGFAGNVSASGTFTDCEVFDINMVEVPASGSDSAGFVAFISGVDVSFENCHVKGVCSISSSGGDDFGVGGFVGETVSSSVKRTFTNCSSVCDVDPATTDLALDRRFGGFIGNVGGGCDFIDCWASGNVSGPLSGQNSARSGGFFGGGNGGSTYTRCFATGDVWSRFAGGGFAGDLGGVNYVFQDCFAWGNVVNTGNASSGFAGFVRSGTTVFNNCYSIGSLTAGGSANGFANGGVATDCYWDTTTGHPTSVVGIGKTTAELQTPISPSGIYINWTDPAWNFGTSTEYPVLT